MRKTVVTHYEDAQIVVVNHWFNGAQLYVDGELRDETSRFFAFGKKPLLRTMAKGTEITVFFKAIFTVQIMVCAGGRIVGGEVFESVTLPVQTYRSLPA